MSPRKMSLWLVNIVIFVCTCTLFTVLETKMIPANKRGFFCNDNSIKFPFKDATVSTTMLVGINAIVGIAAIVITEKFFICNVPPLTMYSERHRNCFTRLCESNHLWPVRTIKVCLLFVWCIFVTIIVTWINGPKMFGERELQEISFQGPVLSHQEIEQFSQFLFENAENQSSCTITLSSSPTVSQLVCENVL